MIKGNIHILLADDDQDDCLLFSNALKELPVTTTLTMVHNGEQLMQFLNSEKSALPHFLFLDLNMPRKNGIECLTEIKLNKHFNHLPIIIFSTSYNPEVVTLLYNKGASYYLRKPNKFNQLKESIYTSLSNISNPSAKHKFENFVIGS